MRLAARYTRRYARFILTDGQCTYIVAYVNLSFGIVSDILIRSKLDLTLIGSNFHSWQSFTPRCAGAETCGHGASCSFIKYLGHVLNTMVLYSPSTHPLPLPLGEVNFVSSLENLDM